MTQIVLSCIPVKGGGGRTVALATMRAVTQSPTLSSRVMLVARRSMIAQLDEAARESVVAVSDHRIVAELQLRRLATASAATWVVNIFGPAPLLVTGKRTSTVCAYSHLFYPEVDISTELGRVRRFVMRSRNVLLLKTVGRSDLIFFETPLLRSRAQHRLGRHDSLRVLAPARDPRLEIELASAPTPADPPTFRVLLFSVHRPNKGWSILPDVTRELARRGVAVEFLLTTRDADDLVARAGDGVCRIRQIGPVRPASRTPLLLNADAILLISQVESFSNNYCEAWAAGLPLVVSDMDWSRSALDDAAIFVDPRSASSIADGVQAAMDPETRRRLRSEGARMLSKMPTPEERVLRLCDELRAADR